MFTTVTDVESSVDIRTADDDSIPGLLNEAELPTKGVWQFTDSRLLQSKRDKNLNLYAGPSALAQKLYRPFRQ